MKTKNHLDREYVNTTDQLTIEADPLVCSLCKIKIMESEMFGKVVFIGSTHYYHESCGKQLVFDKLDNILTMEEKYGVENKDE